MASAGVAASNTSGPPDPFLHMFRELFDGGVQEVVADSMVSHPKIVILQRSLRKKAGEYAKGDYADPDRRSSAAQKLRSQASRIAITYADLPRGGSITFRTQDPTLVRALHEWMAETVRYEQRVHHDGGPGQQTE